MGRVMVAPIFKPECNISGQRCHSEANMARARALATILIEKSSEKGNGEGSYGVIWLHWL